MTHRLKQAIEDVLDHAPPDNLLDSWWELKESYEQEREHKTVTMERIEFLEDRLRSGLNKRAAAQSLAEHDPRIGLKTAETLVYTVFSGAYQNPRKRRRSRIEMRERVPVGEVVDVSAEEDLL